MQIVHFFRKKVNPNPKDESIKYKRMKSKLNNNLHDAQKPMIINIATNDVLRKQQIFPPVVFDSLNLAFRCIFN